MARRFDIGSEIDRSWTKTPHGYLLTNAFPTRTGVLKYRRGGRLHRELRPPEEMAKVLDQIAHAPITNIHKKATPKQLDHFEGVTRSDVILQDDGWVRTSIEVMAAQAIQDIEENKRRHLSGGYDKVTYDETPGWWDPAAQTYILDGMEVPDGFNKVERFDGVQRDLEYSHSMLCAVSRAGEGAGIRYDHFDDSGEVEFIETLERSDEEDDEMKVKINLGGIEYEVEEPVAKAILADQGTRNDALTTATEGYDTLKTDRDGVAEERDQLKGEVKVLKVTSEERHDTMSAEAVNERLRVIGVARAAGVKYLQDDPLKCEKDNAEIMKDAVKTRFDADVSDAEVVGMFRGMEFDKPATFDGVFAAAKAEGTPRHDEGDSYDVAYKAFCDKMGQTA